MIFTLGCTEQTQQTVAPSPETGRAITDEFQKTLGGKLKQAMNEGGPVNAIEVCSQEAQAIAKMLGDKHNVTLRRVSTKPRNTADIPDMDDTKMLSEFALIHSKTPSAPLEKTMTGQNGQNRYYRGITIQPLCLACHGQNLAPAVKTAINKHYPDDKATGYQNGDLRGAFVVEYP